MNLLYKNKQITGILTVIPDNEISFDDEMDNYNFTKTQSMRLKTVMGYGKHCIVAESTCVSDLCVYGLSYLFDNNLLKKDEIDALILVTQSPDHFVPPTSFIIQGRLELKKDLYCIDINQGCTGYLIGLMQAFSLLDQDTIKKVVLLNADVLSRKVSKKDRNSFPIIGDGAAITIVERNSVENTIHANLFTDGSRSGALVIPAGGFRMPSSPETALLEEDDHGNLRSKDHLCMNGTEVFNFVQTEVPVMIDELIELAGTTMEDVDYFMFHQPNRFMLQKLADKMKVPHEKMPNNVVENFGNGSSITIPTAITFNLADELCNKLFTMCLAGFGVGLTWSSMIIDIGNLNFCKMIKYQEEN